MSITLAEIKLQARQRADKVNSKFISEGELAGYINNSIAELHDILCEAYGSEYNVTSEDVAIVDNQENYTLPTDFYELKGVDIQIDNGRWYSLQRFNFNERNLGQTFNVWNVAGLPNARYRIINNNLRLSPTPAGSGTIRIWYVPVATKLVDDTDTLDDLNAYSEYVIVDAAIKMMQKEESDVSVLLLQKQALEKRIRDKSQNRDASTPDTVTDIYINDFYWPYNTDES